MERALSYTHVFILFFVLLLTGCGENNGDVPPPAERVTLSVQPHFCIVSDSTSETITAIVRDMRNSPAAGLALTISLTDTQTGEIRFPDETRRDTTDDQGEVSFYYLGARGMDNTIIVSALGVSDSCVIRSEDIINDPLWLQITVTPDTLRLSAGEADSARVHVELRDQFNIPIQEYHIFLSTNGGYVDRPLQTDSLGTTNTWWHASGSIGTFYIVAYGPEITDSTWITVLP